VLRMLLSQLFSYGVTVIVYNIFNADESRLTARKFFNRKTFQSPAM